MFRTAGDRGGLEFVIQVQQVEVCALLHDPVGLCVCLWLHVCIEIGRGKDCAMRVFVFGSPALMTSAAQALCSHFKGRGGVMF